MVLLSREILTHIVEEFGANEVLRRMSDPFWFQAFGCVLGFDWHSSGVTTTVCGAVKESLREAGPEWGLFAAGGKGATSKKSPAQILEVCERLGRAPDALVYASRIAAKVDNAAVQDGYQLYHHVFFFTASGDWSVVQQGMNERTSTARRYHWLSEHVTNFVEEPHDAVCCDTRGATLNLVARESDDVRRTSAELAGHPPETTLAALRAVPDLRLPARHRLFPELDVDSRYLSKILIKTYERAPEHFEALLGLEGVGAKTLRALALASELIYGTSVSTRESGALRLRPRRQGRHPLPRRSADLRSDDRDSPARRRSGQNRSFGARARVEEAGSVQWFVASGGIFARCRAPGVRR
jgi:hypothetical protein